MPYGVPQGSVLGPLFFIIYVNDLLLLLGQNKQVSVQMYADDTVIYCSAHDVSIATSLCQSALYADQLVESGLSDKVSKLQSLQDKAVRIIDNNEHRGMGTVGLNNLFRMDLLKLRRAEHLACSMYCLSIDASRIETGRPRVHLQSRDKIKFKIQK